MSVKKASTKKQVKRPRSRMTDLKEHYANRLSSDWRRAPFVLRITSHGDVEGPCIVVKERVEKDRGESDGLKRSSTLHQRARLFNGPFKVTESIVAEIVRKVQDEGGVPYGLERFLEPDALRATWTLPLDAEAGAKLALIGKLHESMKGQEQRVELIARRIASLGREEASYFFSWVFRQDQAKNRWAASGLRVLFGGKPKDNELDSQLRSYRSRRIAA